MNTSPDSHPAGSHIHGSPGVIPRNSDLQAGSPIKHPNHQMSEKGALQGRPRKQERTILYKPSHTTRGTNPCGRTALIPDSKHRYTQRVSALKCLDHRCNALNPFMQSCDSWKLNSPACTCPALPITGLQCVCIPQFRILPSIQSTNVLLWSAVAPHELAEVGKPLLTPILLAATYTEVLG